MLRSISLSARTGFTIDNNIIKMIKRYHHLLKDVPSENIREEFNKILLSNEPSKHIILMKNIGILSTILPELDKCYGVKQERKYHKYDVFHHCIYTCDNIKPDIVLRLAALFNDIGKPETKRIKNGRIIFHNHEMVGANIAREVLSRLQYKNKIIEEVVGLIENHMYYYDNDAWSDSAVRRFIDKIGINESNIDNLHNIPIFILRSADRLGNGFKTISVTNYQKIFQERIIQVYRKMKVRTVKDLNIDGNLLIKTFDLIPGPIIGNILNHLLKKIEGFSNEEAMNTKSNLLRWALEYLNRLDKNKRGD
jgi:putative nucleotidyltransferase with HDIG domain